MSGDEFIEKIQNGRDIMFDVLGRHFTILTWPDEGIVVCEQNTADEHVFPDARSLFDGFTVNGQHLDKIIGQLKITFYT